MPLPAQRWEATETYTQRQPRHDHRQPTQSREAALPPLAKAEGFHAAKRMNFWATAQLALFNQATDHVGRNNDDRTSERDDCLAKTGTDSQRVLMTSACITNKVPG
jgi:hypothetical protein